jgi:putative DNA primase/helicase
VPKRKNSDTAVLDAPQSTKPKPRKAKGSRYLRCAADYPAQNVQWLWPGRIPLGKVTLLSGDPGTGKSLLTIDIASRVTRGAAWPDEEQNPPSALPLPLSRPGSVLILSIEDDLGDTIRPRLDAAGADPKRVFVLDDIDDLRHDMDKLREAVDAAPNCRLIVIDSINAFVGPGDSHFHTIVRRVLRPLAELAAERNLAVLAVSHFRKSEGAAITRTTGSMGFVAASRAVWTVSRDKQQPGRHLMLPMKNNFVGDSTGLGFRIESKPTANGPQPAISWLAGAVASKTQEALDRENKPKSEDESELSLAAAWLREELADGPQPAMHVYAEGVIMGDFKLRTLRRALASIGGITHKTGFQGGWIWELPGQSEIRKTVVEPAEDTPETLAPSQHVGPLGEKQTSAWPLRTNPDDFADFDSHTPWKIEAAEVRPSMTITAFEALIKKIADRKFATQPPPE